VRGCCKRVIRQPMDPQAIRERISSFPKAPGVYLFKDAEGRVLYIGKAKDLRSRVSSYFQPSADLLASRGPMIAGMIEQVADVDILACESEVEALLQENRLIKDIHPPFNERLTDDKSFPYLQITVRDEFPGVYITRKPRKGSRLFGPFVDVKGLRAALPLLQRVFKFRTCRLDIRCDDPKRKFFRPCLLHPIELCSAPCAARIPKEQYRQDIARLIKFLSGKRSAVLRQLQRKMQQASKELHFEEAAKLRDQIKALESLSLSGKPRVHVQPEVFFIHPGKGLASLGRLLKLSGPPRIIEGIDIANIQGQEACGSLVSFIDGVPFKEGYRRFKIKTVEGIDDYAMIREVVTRRYRHAADGEALWPDLILIDGGAGQLHAALEALEALTEQPPKVISLAKREEEIYTPDRPEPVRLGRNNPALKLLQQVRDEAHRFAQHYHHILRRKKTFEEHQNPTRHPGAGSKGRL